MEFRLFGQVEVHAAGQLLDVGTPRQQAVLAALIVDARRPVAMQTLIDRVWDEEPPVEARNVLYSHLSRLRQLLRHAAALTGDTVVRIERRHAGYVLNIDPDTVDLHRFQRLIDQGCDPERADAARVDALTEALGLWRATPLAALPGEWAAQVRSGWHRRRLDAAVQWAQIELRLGHPTVVITVLHDLIVEYPLVEPLEDLLMRALHAAGRGAEAIDRYAIVRQRLADELGVDPSPPLQLLHRQILTADPALTAPTPVTRPPTAGSTVPRQLPAPPRSFAGRTDELARLDTLLNADGEHPTAVLISALSGTAGIGKTALAMHWAHRAADRFPDGQLYVNLRGFDPGGQTMEPVEAVRGFLDALQVPPQRIPVELDAQTALYRSQLAGRRMLVVLDNARDTTQVRPLLPGAPTCLVLITSRNQLSGLVAADGAHPLTLDLLTQEEARQLLARRLGADRVAAEPAAVAEIITRCAHLPLALALVAARAALRPRVGLHILANELRDAQQRWETLTGDDPTSDVRTVFSWSYQALTPAAARLFRLLGLHPGPDIAAPAAASLAAIPPTAIRPVLAELTRASLLAEHIPGRYTFHDLLRAYATDLTHTTDPDQQRHAATGRILDHYLHTALTADRLLYPARDPLALTPRQPGVTPEHLTDYQQAMAWFTAEHPVLLAAIDAAATGFDTHTWQLAWTLWTFLDRRGHWHYWAATGRAAVAATQRLADPTAQARAHGLLAHAYTRLGRFDDADTQLRHALDRATQAGDQVGQAHTHHRLGYLWGRRGRHAQALDHARQALDLYQAAGHQRGQANALNQVGWYHALLGNHQEALTSCQQALTLHQELGDRHGQAATCDSLGYTHHHLGHHTEALTCYQHALTLYRDLGDRYYEADTLTHLGDTHHATGNPHAARDAWQQALTILDDLDHPDAGQVRTKLALDIPTRPGGGPDDSGTLAGGGAGRLTSVH